MTRRRIEHTTILGRLIWSAVAYRAIGEERTDMRCGLLLVAMLVVGLTIPQPTRGQNSGTLDAVFMLVSVKYTGATFHGHYQSVAIGTAFFISDDGTAITNSHVVYLAQHNPDFYRLVAVVGKELYSVQVICASNLPQDPSQSAPARGVTFSRDVAELRVIPLDLPSLETWGYREGTGFVKVADAHRGPLPRFRSLTVADHPRVGDKVRIIGYGIQSILIHPQQWTTDGTVTTLGRLRDGTEAFVISSTLRPQEGNSGSPVLNEDDHVVGLWTWYSISHADLSIAQANSALEHPCGI